jgi:hypothetical protein
MKLHEKLDRIEQTLGEFRNETTVELTEIKKDLAYHIRRTDILEARVKDLATDAKPILTILTILTYVGKILVPVAAMAAVLKALGVL